MKYIYIILFVLSSFFSHKSLYAKENTLLHAFFVPENSVQSNTTIKELNPSQQTHTDLKKKRIKRRIKKRNQVATSSPNKQSSPSKKTRLRKAPHPKKTNIATSNNDFGSTKTITPKNKYTLEDNPAHQLSQNQQIEEKTKTPKIEISLLEQLKQTPTNELLSTIPYPTSKEPAFRQLYENHVMDLRTLYRHNKMIDNLELENVIKKANTIRRFNVTN